jgi:hypothetical protein
MMDAVTLRRPSSIVTQSLPPIHTKVYEYASESCYTKSSNLCLEEFKHQKTSKGKGSSWARLIRARQFAYHHMLIQLHDIEQRSQLAAMTNKEAIDDVV